MPTVFVFFIIGLSVPIFACTGFSKGRAFKGRAFKGHAFEGFTATD